MEVTGYDYIIYSPKSIFSLKAKIIEQIRVMWVNCICDDEWSVNMNAVGLSKPKTPSMVCDETKGCTYMDCFSYSSIKFLN